ncbi:hypothetical protein H2198_007463 [Neophaeococcomyces mojaviensis]|uniref:Uncharacterized protein n=1 Tax=Neophaeococcomyces mojaviensis TaxID=3383035 RepID=A0ACC3A075_9EURO|nr:hypothetical protein H2198_007463 [Knufia sp. JES_112]
MSDAQTRSEPPESLRKAYVIFSRRDPSAGHIQTMHLDEKIIIGINSQLEGDADLIELRRLFVQSFSYEETGILQVVGDSGRAFNQAAIPRALEVLSEQTAQRIIEYGYTAVEYDTNWLVAEYISKLPEVRSRVIANAVGQSIQCLQDPSWSGSLKVANFVMLYDRDSDTEFGQDVWLSDGIMSPDFNDEMLCFEGGIQAFCQCTNALVKNIKVVAMTNLRPSELHIKFSAARLLLQLKKTDASSDVQERAREYLSQLLDQSAKQIDIVRTQVNRIVSSDFDWRNCILEA